LENTHQSESVSYSISMPGRNVVKQYENGAFYHVYNRGVNKRLIFLDYYDYRVFLNLLKRYLDEQPSCDNRGRQYPWLRADVTLLAYCLMPNHFHLLVRQKREQGISRLLQNVSTSYAAYFNKRHRRVGNLFQGVFRARGIDSDSYLQHISRYIHANPRQYAAWLYSSYQSYLTKQWPAWLQPDYIVHAFEAENYAQFVADYKPDASQQL